MQASIEILGALRWIACALVGERNTNKGEGNAEGVGIAEGIIDEGARRGIKVKVNLVFLSVHQPNDIILDDDLAKRGIQFTYANDNMGVSYNPWQSNPVAKMELKE